ncbi:MAG: AlkZ family DNA glycosylase [Chloroflexi bacterium]|nr:AlkZ family DNA glycosylase [Chloroflexota bacterium]
MPGLNIARQRLANQLIANSVFDHPAQVVQWLVAVQAQDYLGALWAVGLRTRGATEKEIELALANRTIVRTWPMRGTLHFVAADDVRWMLDLLTPRVIAASASRYKQLELDQPTFLRSRKAIVHALQGGKQLEREEMYQVLESAHVSTAGQRGIHILGRLAQEGVICFGARAGKQQTFVLLDEWAPQSKHMERDAALAELAKRYFTGHGPATLQDFAWWSGLSTADARAGLDLVKPYLMPEVVADQIYWLASSTPIAKAKTRTAYLLPGFDEYLVGYKDRSAVLDPLYVKQTNAGGGMLNPTIVINGQVVGTWKRKLPKSSVVITSNWFTAPKKSDQHALAVAARRYGAFLGLSVMLV